MFKEVIFFSAQGDNLQIWNMIRKNIRDKLIVDLKKKKFSKVLESLSKRPFPRCPKASVSRRGRKRGVGYDFILTLKARVFKMAPSSS